MFHCKTAWFSSSVRRIIWTFGYWKVGALRVGGEADYLFSADATCPDTLRIYESKDYIWNKVTVLHSLFLATCEKRQSVKSVSIGHYVLPPASVQDEVRKVVGRLIWEQEDEDRAAQEAQKTFSPSEAEGSEQEVRRSVFEASDTDSSENEDLFDPLRSPVSYEAPVYVSIESLPKYSGDLRDVHPGLFRCSKCKTYFCLGHRFERHPSKKGK